MKWIPTFLCFLAFSTGILGQETLLPLQSNQVLQDRYSLSITSAPSFSGEIADVRFLNGCENIDLETFSDGQDVFCTSEIPRKICISTQAFPQIDSIACGNCDELVDGSATILSGEFCIEYTPIDISELSFNDTLAILVCDDNANCEEVLFPLIIRRENITVMTPESVIPIETTLELCSPVSLLPGEIYSYNLAFCEGDNLGSLGEADSCFQFTSTRFAGLTAACLIATDEWCISDTFRFPIRVVGDTLPLPIFEDFSYAGPYPDPSLWLDDQVFINNSLAFQPPSIGVATFDGIDEKGTPYVGGFGISDKLTSNYLDLSGLNADNVYLSFYAAPKGLGFAPGPTDSLILEFKDQSGDWVKVWTDVVDQSYSLIDQVPFEDISTVHINQPGFLFSGFQFRFYNLSSNVGLNDLWHLDYVRINKDEIPTGRFSDIAFTQYPENLLSNYSALPWKQFDGHQSSELITGYSVSLRSFFEETQSIGNSSLSVEETTNAVTVLSGNTLLDAANIPPSEETIFDRPMPGFDLEGLFDPSDMDLKVDLSYTIEVGDENPAEFPAVEQNNSVITTTHFSDYLAYDDGTAELALKLEDTGQSLAIEFDINEPDSLQGFSVMFPRLGQPSSVGFRVRIHQSDLSSPAIFLSGEYETLFADALEEKLQGFTTYKLRNESGDPEALNLDPGNYFLVIEQIQPSIRILIGLDQNNIQYSDKQYFFLDDSWAGLDIPGSLLLRAILGAEEPIATNIGEQQQVSLKVFPNPSSGLLNIQVPLENFKATIYDLFGREVFTSNNNPLLDVSDLVPGTYYLEVGSQDYQMREIAIIQILR
ncbi:MAG: T9SS type A sorting domain-containing protein [Saprospiraceae bacterium]|nr:T9SS type A sorting domain-containing protein [Saprospiraceae bacterium]